MNAFFLRLALVVYALSVAGAILASSRQADDLQTSASITTIDHAESDPVLGDDALPSDASPLVAQVTDVPATAPTNAVAVPVPVPGGGSGSLIVAPQRPGRDQVLVGFALNCHHTDKPERFSRAIDDIAAAGFNSILLLVPAFQRDGASEKITIMTGPARAPSKEQLISILKYARSKGLATTLMPAVLLTDPRGNEWRGKISPSNWDNWWTSYRAMLDYHLDIASAGGASVVCVGSELLSTEKQTERWESIIAHARSKFTGRLSYSTNWDHYHVPTFWRKLDLIGINGYWNIATMTDADEPDPAKLAERWREIREQVLAFGQAQNKPVLLTEIGYPSLSWALKDPWNYIASGNKPDFHAQALGYQAFLTTWRDMLLPPKTDVKKFAGVFFYQWDIYYDGGHDDTGYGVRGKPALNLLRNFLSTGDVTLPAAK